MYVWMGHAAPTTSVWDLQVQGPGGLGWRSGSIEAGRGRMPGISEVSVGWNLELSPGWKRVAIGEHGGGVSC